MKSYLLPQQCSASTHTRFKSCFKSNLQYYGFTVGTYIISLGISYLLLARRVGEASL